jgi:hypothetical protein
VTHEISDDETYSSVTEENKVYRKYFYWTLVEIFENEDIAYDKLSNSQWKFKQNI